MILISLFDKIRALVNVWLGLVAIVLFCMMAVQSFAPLPETETFYVFQSGSEVRQVAKMINPLSSHALGYTRLLDDGYLVVVDEDLPKMYQNMAIRHENCHVQQFKSGMKMGSWTMEPECYFRMLLP